MFFFPNEDVREKRIENNHPSFLSPIFNISAKYESENITFSNYLTGLSGRVNKITFMKVACQFSTARQR